MRITGIKEPVKREPAYRKESDEDLQKRLDTFILIVACIAIISMGMSYAKRTTEKVEDLRETVRHQQDEIDHLRFELSKK